MHAAAAAAAVAGQRVVKWQGWEEVVEEQLQQVVEQREAAFDQLLGARSTLGQQVSPSDLEKLLEVAEAYVALNQVYDKVTTSSADSHCVSTLARSRPPPPPTHTATHSHTC